MFLRGSSPHPHDLPEESAAARVLLLRTAPRGRPNFPQFSTGGTREKIYLVGEDGQSIVTRCEAAKPGLFAGGERLPVRERAGRADLFAQDYVINRGAAVAACRSCWRTGVLAGRARPIFDRFDH